MEQFLLMVFAIIGLVSTLFILTQWIHGVLEPTYKEVSIKEVIKQKAKVTGSSNNQTDAEYDKLINNIISDGKPVRIDEYHLFFEYQNKEYGIWINNKTCAYGNSLKSGHTKLVDDRGIKQSTANELYKIELAFIKLNGSIPTKKDKEDAFISSMLEDN